MPILYDELSDIKPVIDMAIRRKKESALADRLESFIPRGDGYNSDYANTLTEAVEVLRAKAAPKSSLTEAQERLYYGAKAAPAEVPYALRQWAMEDEPESTLFDEGYNAARRWVKMQLEKPAEPTEKILWYTGNTAEPTEAVEVVGYQWLDTANYRKVIPAYVDQAGIALRHELMTVAQHKRLMANHSADDLNMVKVPRELLSRWECELDQIPKAFHISDEITSLLIGAV